MRGWGGGGRGSGVGGGMGCSVILSGGVLTHNKSDQTVMLPISHGFVCHLGLVHTGEVFQCKSVQLQW